MTTQTTQTNTNESQTPGPEVEEATTSQTQQQVPATNQALMGLQEDGSFKVRLGNGITIPSALFNGEQANLEGAGLGITGIKLTAFKKKGGDRPGGELTAAASIPRVTGGELTMPVSSDGEVTEIKGEDLTLNFAALNNPVITNLHFDESKQFGATVKIESGDLKPAKSPLEISTEGEITLQGADLSGSLTANMTYPELASGSFTVNFKGSEVTGEGEVAIEHPLLAGTTAQLGLTEDQMTAAVSVPVSQLAPPVPGLTLSSGNVLVNVEGTNLSGGLENVTFDYKDFASGTISATIADGKLNGQGQIASTLPGLGEASGEFGYSDNAFDGKLTIDASHFPEGLGISAGSITVSLDNEGKMAFEGEMSATLGPVGEGTFSAMMDSEGNTQIGADITIDIPGLMQGSQVHVALVNGELEGSGEIPVAPEMLPGVSGTVKVEYSKNLWSGESEFAFEADNGRIGGTVKVGVKQTEEKGLVVYGGGSLTMQLTDNIAGTVGAEITEEGKVVLDMNIAVEPLELFPEKRIDKELFSISQNIPLWAILVAVIRMRAGARAGIGPGQFRDISVTGSYTIGDPAGPELDFTGELFVPAFAEGYVAFGAGIGLDVVIGSVTGGIEGVATAGIYGAVSVKPLLEYTNGDWSISGSATMAAGARFKLGLNAWAEAEAAWITVWENTWALAEKTWNIGPNLALQFQLQNYILGSGEVPEITMEDPDIGSIDSMISDAMPKDAPAPSGARTAMKQEQANWKGKKQGEGKPPAPTPEQQAQASKPPKDDPDAKPPVQMPKKPDKKPPPPDSENKDPAKDAAKADDKDKKTDDKKTTDSGKTLTEDKVPKETEPRYPATITLDILKQAPVQADRTMEQKKQDLKAAADTVKLVMNTVKTSTELEAYYPDIQKRFGLAFIGPKDEGPDKSRVQIKINPVTDIENDTLASGPKPKNTNKGTDIKYRKGKLHGSEVGLGMEVDWLGPTHVMGSDTTAGKQSSLMDLLVTNPEKGIPGHQKYIRGHLLNDQLGGQAVGQNLFPITQEANAAHHAKVEKRVKKWVNDDRTWAYYKVDVTGIKDGVVEKDKTKDIRVNKIDATFHCKAHQRSLNDDNAKGEQLEFKVDSHFLIPKDAITGATPQEKTQNEQAAQKGYDDAKANERKHGKVTDLYAEQKDEAGSVTRAADTRADGTTVQAPDATTHDKGVKVNLIEKGEKKPPLPNFVLNRLNTIATTSDHYRKALENQLHGIRNVGGEIVNVVMLVAIAKNENGLSAAQSKNLSRFKTLRTDAGSRIDKNMAALQTKANAAKKVISESKVAVTQAATAGEAAKLAIAAKDKAVAATTVELAQAGAAQVKTQATAANEALVKVKAAHATAKDKLAKSANGPEEIQAAGAADTALANAQAAVQSANDALVAANKAVEEKKTAQAQAAAQSTVSPAAEPPPQATAPVEAQAPQVQVEPSPVVVSEPPEEVAPAVAVEPQAVPEVNEEEDP